MANYRLTVGNIVNIPTGETSVTANFGTSDTFNVVMLSLSYKKKIFAPSEIFAELSITATGTTKTNPTLASLQNSFSRKLVKLEYGENSTYSTVAENFFVFKMKPIFPKVSTTDTVGLKVELYIFSMDKLLTIDKYCNAFTARKLGKEVFLNELSKFKVLDSGLELKGKVDLQILNYPRSTDQQMTEVRQPYMVQYNETFYDFLARYSSRCGEFLFFEDGILHLGMSPNLKTASSDQNTIAQSIDYEDCMDQLLSLKYRHYNFFKYSSTNDNRYVDSTFEVLGAYKSEEKRTDGTKEGGIVTETTTKDYENGTVVTTVVTTYYTGNETVELEKKLKGNPKSYVKTVTENNKDGKKLTEETESTTYLYSPDSTGTDYEKDSKGAYVFTTSTSHSQEGEKIQGVYNQPEANDGNFEELKKDGYTEFMYEWVDYRLWVFQGLFLKILNNTTLYDILSDIAWSLVQTSKDTGVDVKKKNDRNNDKNLTLTTDENPEQTDGTNFSLFSTLKSQITESSMPVNKTGNDVSLLVAEFYSKMQTAAAAVSRMVVKLTYGESHQSLKLGDVIKVNGEFYIVKYVEMENNSYSVEAMPLFYQEVSADKKSITSAIPCAPLMPEIPTIKVSEPQVAFVEKNLDPNRFGRVRVRYPWQTKDGDLSPWVRMATPFATAGGGVTFRPYAGDEVLLNYEDGNIERPYIVGSLQSKYVTDPWLPLPDRVIQTKNGHSITFTDGDDGANFLWGLLPGSSLIKSCIPIYEPLITDQNMVDLTGGINIHDRYGLYQISMSSDKRAVTINSTLGTIKLNAFTGITISAPNGNVKIEGKNVSIAASNKLTLTSGSGIGERWFPVTKEGWKDLGKGVVKDVLDRTLGKLIDFSFLRTILEVFTRPVDGTLKIKSNTYVLIEAGKGAAQVPYDDYKHPTIEFIKSPVKNFVDQGILLGKLKKSIDMFTSKVETLGKNIIEAYDKADRLASDYKNMKWKNDNLYDQLEGKMQLSDIVDKVNANKDNAPFISYDVITVDDFEFDTKEYFKYQLGKDEKEPTDDGGQTENFHTLLANYKSKQIHDGHCKLYRMIVLMHAQALADDIWLLFKAVKALTEFEFTEQEKKEYYTSDYMRDFIQNLDTETQFITDVTNGSVTWGKGVDIQKQLTIWKHKVIYELINSVKDEDYYREMFGVGSDAEPNDFGSEEDWKKFADKIGEPNFTPSTALTVDRKIRGALKSYLWDGKASQWLDSFTCHHRWKAAENGKVLISDHAGETICFERGLPAINHSYGTGNNAYYLELRKKVNGVK